MTEYLVTNQLQTSYTVPVLAEDCRQAIAAALEQDPPARPTQDTEKTAVRALRLTHTERGLHYLEDRGDLFINAAVR